MLLTACATGVITSLAFVLILAATGKLRRRSPAAGGFVGFERVRSLRGSVILPALELVVAGFALLAPGGASGLAQAVLFAGFALAHTRSSGLTGAAGCQCFGLEGHESSSPGIELALTAGSAGLAAAAGVANPPSLIRLIADEPGTAVAVAIGALLATAAWRLAFSSLGGRGVNSHRLVASSASFIERRVSRRTLLIRVAVTGSALCVAPLRYLLHPISALAIVSPGVCEGGLCTDGYTAFCCEINDGLNTCPAGTFAGGWWMCTDYAGHRLCSEQGVRYYVDCNALPNVPYPGGCHCANADCAYRRVDCNIFRYGQCNTQIDGITGVVCRMIVCENPSTIPALNCSSSLAIDDAVCGHDVPCLEPPALELAGAGGV